MRDWFEELFKAASAVLGSPEAPAANDQHFAEYVSILIPSEGSTDNPAESETPFIDAYVAPAASAQPGIPQNTDSSNVPDVGQSLSPTSAAGGSSFGIAHVDLDAERVIPLTRKRLRRRESITWPALYDGNSRARSAAERLGLLEELRASSKIEYGPLLARAYKEENGAQRLAVLRAFIADNYPEGPDVFRQALRAENDAERTLAIDGLVQSACRHDLIVAFDDRVEALAAKAALAYAASRRRRDLVESLSPHMDAGRLTTILALLAGALE